MTNLMTTAQAAERLGLTQRTVQYHAQRRGLGQRIGRDILLTPGEVESLRPGPKATASWTCPECGSVLRATRPEAPPRCFPPRWVCPWCP